MGIAVQPWQFTFSVSNLTGAPPTVDPGTAITAGANNADGTAVTLLSALAQDVHYLTLSVADIFISAGNGNALLDILVDPAGGTSWTSFIDDLIVGTTSIPTGGSLAMALYYNFPIFIKAGTSIGARVRTAHTANITTGHVCIGAFGGPSNPDMWWCGQKVESLGLTAASSKGVTHTPGNTGTFSSWASVGASGHPYGAVQFGIQSENTTLNELMYHWQFGYDSTQLPGSPTIHTRCITTENIMHISPRGYPIWCDVAGNTTWQVRGTCSGTGQAHNVAVYGVY